MKRQPQRKTTARNKYITRIDHRNTHAWFVRVPVNYRKNPTHYHHKLFSDGLYGGAIKAKRVAREYRDHFLKKTKQTFLVEPTTCSARPPRVRDSRNTSGIIGVRIQVQEKLLLTGGTTTHYAWEAYGMINKVAWRKTFATKRYGEREAFILACRERYRRQGPLSVVGSLSDLPCRIPVPYVRC